jgi:hypothetical protein
LYLEAFRFIQRRLSKKGGWYFWKSNGDELLFYNLIDRGVRIDRKVTQADKVMVDCIKDMHSRFDCYNDIEQLSIKTTMWIAHVKDFGPKVDDQTPCENYRINLSGATDFIGKEIDIGFRISKYTPRSKTALSAALVYYLLKQKSRIVRKVRIAGYSILKGVWDDKRYPILWLFRKISHQAMIESFHYDEKYDNEYVGEFIFNLDRNSKYGRIKRREFVNMLEYLGLRSQYDAVF